MKKQPLVLTEYEVFPRLDISKKSLASDIVEVRIFKNKNNKQFNLPVLKKNTSPNIIQAILNNKNVAGLRFKITDVIFKNNTKGVGRAVHLSHVKGGKI